MAYTITFQKNQHPRDYIYECSVFYLLARAFQWGVNEHLFNKLHEKSLTEETLFAAFPHYKPTALQDLMDIFSALALIDTSSPHNGRVFSAMPLLSGFCTDAIKESAKKQITEWETTYALFHHACKPSNRASWQRLLAAPIEITINNHQLSLSTDTPENIATVCIHLHWLARAIRLVVESGLVDKIANQEGSITLQLAAKHLITYEKNFNNSDQEQLFGEVNETDIQQNGDAVFRLLDRFQLLRYDAKEKVITFSDYSPYLCTNEPATIAPALKMMDKPWWNATQQLPISLKKPEKSLATSAFEAHNGKAFGYGDEKAPQSTVFHEGLASIALMDDETVAQCIYDHIPSDITTIVDIAGGNGSLLHAFAKKYQTTSPELVLFEQPSVIERIKANPPSHADKLTLKAGDFLNSTNDIPTYNNALYVMKCTLHNFAPEKIALILDHIHQSMGKNCHFFLAERIVPEDKTTLHFNQISHLLMRMLFACETYAEAFYKQSFNQAGFSSEIAASQQWLAGAYTIFKRQPTSNKSNILIASDSPLATSTSPRKHTKITQAVTTPKNHQSLNKAH